MAHDVDLESAAYEHAALKFGAGTPNVAGPIGLAAAVGYLTRTGRDAIRRHERSLTEHALARLAGIRGLRVLGPTTAVDRVPCFRCSPAGGRRIWCGARCARYRDSRWRPCRLTAAEAIGCDRGGAGVVLSLQHDGRDRPARCGARASGRRTMTNPADAVPAESRGSAWLVLVYAAGEAHARAGQSVAPIAASRRGRAEELGVHPPEPRRSSGGLPVDRGRDHRDGARRWCSGRCARPATLQDITGLSVRAGGRSSTRSAGRRRSSSNAGDRGARDPRGGGSCRR